MTTSRWNVILARNQVVAVNKHFPFVEGFPCLGLMKL